MIKVLSALQMQEIDQLAIKDLAIPSLILMENAGRAVLDHILDQIKLHKISNPKVTIICGKGNNGGDGFVAARHLIEDNITVNVISLYDEFDIKGDALINHNVLKHFTNIFYYDSTEEDEIISLISNSDIVLDAVLGTGVSGEVKGLANEAILKINEYAKGLVISVDISSGINASNGEVLGNAVYADSTITFYAPKIGNILYPGTEYCGDVEVANISIPEYILDNEHKYNISLLTDDFVSKNLPTRPNDSHKGTFGSVMTIAGSKFMPGAAFMSASSALRSGAGYSVLATLESLIPTFASMMPELIYTPLKDNSQGCFEFSHIDVLFDKAMHSNSFIIGPGMGTNQSTVDFIKEFVQQASSLDMKCVFDADALNCLSLIKDFSLPINSILTPHVKELARLLNKPTGEILEDVIASAQEAAMAFNSIIVLKGARTVIASPDNQVFINTTGCSAMATAGSGDVLAGMIGGFTAQGLSPLKSALISVYLHGLAGELAAEKYSEYSVTAMNVAEFIPFAIKSVI